MPHKSRWTVPIPSCSLPSFLFTSASHIEPPELADKPCYLSTTNPEKHHLTRAQFKLWSQRFAKGLLQMPDFKPGDRVLLFSGNNMAFPVAFMGIIMAGGVFSAANPTFTARELAHQLRDSGATYLLCAEGTLESVLQAAKDCNHPVERIRYMDADTLWSQEPLEKPSISGIKHWQDIFAPEAHDYQWPELKGDGEAEDTLIALNYSSGTTGVPKGVMITHKNYVSNTIQHQHLQTLYPDAEERRTTAKWLCYLPLYHAMAQTIYLSGGLHRQVPVYIMPKFEFVPLLENLSKYKITDLQMVPPIAVALTKQPIVKKYDLSNIRSIGSGAAPLGSEASRELEKLWNGKLNLKQGWGMTEVTCSLLGWDPTEYSESFSVGYPNANCEAKLVSISENPSGKEEFTEVTERGDSARGELWCRGPNIMKGYWKNPTATKGTFSPDGKWLRTGDVAYVDEKGRFFIVDRIKELIKVKGLQVAPAELEAIIFDHPAVTDVAVIGVETADGDERPRAFCVKQPNANVTAEEIQDFVKDKVVRYKWLEGGVEFVDAIPKNPSGKILRKQLRESVKKRAERKARL